MNKIHTGPNGEKRPDDTNSCAIMVAKIATGEIREDHKSHNLKKMAERTGFEPANARDVT